VTAWSVEDAFALIESAGFSIDSTTAAVRENVWPHEVGFYHVVRKEGPAVFRGVWYPCLNIGCGASGQH